MNKITNKNLVGQPIFSQVLNYIPKTKIASIIREKNSDKYYKKIHTFKHLVVMLFGVISKCHSLREICDGMLVCEGKLNHLAIDSSPKRSTLADANKNRSHEVFESIYYMLIGHYKSILSDSKIVGLSIQRLFAIDSTTISLFSNILEGVGRNPKKNGKKKGGIKAHMLIDAKEGVAKFIKLTAAKIHDSTFLKYVMLPKGSYVVFDKAYNKYKLFAEWTERGVYFVTRMKENAVFKILEVKRTYTIPYIVGVIREEIIELTYMDNKEEKTIKLMRIEYVDPITKRALTFISNSFELTAEEIALIYKNRWQIELLFKKIKQNFQLKYFVGDTENVIKIQIWVTLIAHLIVSIIKKVSKSKKAFSNIVTTIRIHLMSYVKLLDFLKNTLKTWEEMKNEKKQEDTQYCLWGP